MEVNLDMQSAVMSAYENSTFGPYRVIYENEEFLCIHRYMRKQQQREPVYWTLISGVNYRNGKIIRHETAIEELSKLIIPKKSNYIHKILHLSLIHI